LYKAISSGGVDLLIMSKDLVNEISNDFIAAFEEMINVAEMKEKFYERAKNDLIKMIQ
jgi:hypothetical protein